LDDYSNSPIPPPVEQLMTPPPPSPPPIIHQPQLLTQPATSSLARSSTSLTEPDDDNGDTGSPFDFRNEDAINKRAQSRLKNFNKDDDGAKSRMRRLQEGSNLRKNVRDQYINELRSQSVQNTPRAMPVIVDPEPTGVDPEAKQLMERRMNTMRSRSTLRRKEQDATGELVDEFESRRGPSNIFAPGHKNVSHKVGEYNTRLSEAKRSIEERNESSIARGRQDYTARVLSGEREAELEQQRGIMDDSELQAELEQIAEIKRKHLEEAREKSIEKEKDDTIKLAKKRVKKRGEKEEEGELDALGIVRSNRHRKEAHKKEKQGIEERRQKMINELGEKPKVKKK
jgi:hypothetical protein